MGRFEIDLDDFQGPLDLLLHLIEKQGLDITGVSILAVSDQFIIHAKSLKENFPDVASEFLLVGSQLALLKSRALLPQVDPDETEEESLEDLAARLRLYMGFKSVANNLDARLRAGANSFIRLAAPVITQPPVEKGTGDIEALVQAISSLLESDTSDEPPMTAPILRHRVADKIKDLEARVRRKGEVDFARIAAECNDRGELVVTFLALLHLVHRRQIAVIQKVSFGAIILKAVKTNGN